MSTLDLIMTLVIDALLRYLGNKLISHKISENIGSLPPKLMFHLVDNHVGKGNPVGLLLEYRKYQETLTPP